MTAMDLVVLSDFSVRLNYLVTGGFSSWYLDSSAAGQVRSSALGSSTASNYDATVAPNSSTTFTLARFTNGGATQTDDIQHTYNAPPSTPGVPIFTAYPVNGTAALAWDDIGATGYEVYRDGVLIATQAGTTFQEARGQTSSSYKVRAYNTGPYGTRYGAYTSTIVVTTNDPPNAPTLTTMAAGGVVDRAVTNRAAHAHSDPNGSGQSAFRLRYRIVGAGSWTTLPDQVTANQFYDFAPASIPAGDYERQVQTADTAGAWGPWSASGFFSAADVPAGPTITAPISGQTILAPTQVVTWSYPTVQAWEWRLLNAAGTVLAGPTAGPTAAGRSFTLTGLVDGVAVRPQVRVQVDGLWSAWADQTNPVSFTPPPAPTALLTNDPDTASVTLTISSPPASGSEPAVVSHEVWVRTTGRDSHRPYSDTGVRIARDVDPGAPAPLTGVRTTEHVDYAVASGVDYEYRVVSVATTGATAASAWALYEVDDLTELFTDLFV